MSQKTEQGFKADYLIDSITLDVVKVLLENPKIPYNKSALAEVSDVSRDALYRRWPTFQATGIVEKAEVESKSNHWQLNKDSELVDLFSKLLDEINEF